MAFCFSRKQRASWTVTSHHCINLDIILVCNATSQSAARRGSVLDAEAAIRHGSVRPWEYGPQPWCALVPIWCCCSISLVVTKVLLLLLQMFQRQSSIASLSLQWLCAVEGYQSLFDRELPVTVTETGGKGKLLTLRARVLLLVRTCVLASC